MLNTQNRNQIFFYFIHKREKREEQEIKIDKDLPWQPSPSLSHIHLLRSVKRYENIMNSFNSIKFIKERETSRDGNVRLIFLSTLVCCIHSSNIFPASWFLKKSLLVIRRSLASDKRFVFLYFNSLISFLPLALSHFLTLLAHTQQTRMSIEL